MEENHGSEEKPDPARSDRSHDDGRDHSENQGRPSGPNSPPPSNEPSAATEKKAGPPPESAQPAAKPAPAQQPDARKSADQRSHPRRKLWWIIAAVVLVLGLATVFVVRHHAEKKKQEEAEKRKNAPVPVTVTPARRGDIGVHLTAPGTVTPQQNVIVRSRVDGALVAVHFTEGQMVKRGDLLAEIDAAPFRAAVKQAEGQLAHDRAELKNARLDLERYRRVYEQHAIPQQQVQTQEAVVEQDEGTVQHDDGALDDARVQLGYTQIRAPVDGRVGLRLLDVGNMVHATDATGLAVIAQLSPITVVFGITEDRLGEVAGEFKQGQPMPVEVWDRDSRNRLSRGTLLTIDNQIDAATGTVKAKALFDNQQAELFPNQFVNANLLVRTVRDATLIPSAAIQRQNEKSSVFVVADDRKVQSRPIQVVTTDGDSSAVTGINPDDQVVIDGFDKLHDGSEVEIKTPEEKARKRARRKKRATTGKNLRRTNQVNPSSQARPESRIRAAPKHRTRRASQVEAKNESFSAVHSATGCDVVDHCGNRAHGLDCVSRAAGFGAT